MDQVQKRKVSLAVVLGVLALGAIVLLAKTGMPQSLDKRTALESAQAPQIYDGDIDAPEVDPESVEVAAKAEEILKEKGMKEGKTEEDARNILTKKLSDANEDGDFLEDLVSEWKMEREPTSADSQSSYYVNKRVSPRFGGRGGRPCTFYKRGKVITQVCVRSGALIDAIKVRYSDGTWSRLRGGRGGRYHCTRLPGKCMSSVFIKAGGLVDGILFAKSGGGISPYYGGYGGQGRAVSNYGGCLYRIKVRYGRFVNSLQFFFTKRPTRPRPRPKPKGCGKRNVALRRPTGQSSTGWGGAPQRGVDGNKNRHYGGRSCTHTAGQWFPFWYVNIGHKKPVCSVKIFNRVDCCANRLRNFKIFVTNRRPGRGFRVRPNELCYYYRSGRTLTVNNFKCYKPRKGRYVGIQIMGKQYLTLCEVQVFTTRGPIRPPMRPRVRLAPFFRYWRVQTGDHFYTTNAGEIGTTVKGRVGRHGYKSEGIACYIARRRYRGLVPLFRYWQPQKHDHFYTTNWREIGTTRRGQTGKYGYKSEGVAGYCSKKRLGGSVALFRYWNKDITDHFYTTNWRELGRGKHGWKYEGVQCYVWKKAFVRLMEEMGALPLVEEEGGEDVEGEEEEGEVGGEVESTHFHLGDTAEEDGKVEEADVPEDAMN